MAQRDQHALWRVGTVSIVAQHSWLRIQCGHSFTVSHNCGLDLAWELKCCRLAEKEGRKQCLRKMNQTDVCRINGEENKNLDARVPIMA